MIARTWGRLGLLARLALACGVMWAALGSVLLASFARHEIDELTEYALAGQVADLALLAAALQSAMAGTDGVATAHILRTFAQRPGIQRIEWSGPKSGQSSWPGTAVARAAPVWFERLVGLPGHVVSRGVGVGAGAQVTLHLNPVPAVNDIWHRVSAAMLPVLAGLATLLGVALATLGFALRPLARLTAALRDLGNGDFSARVDAGGPPEIAAGLRAFNAMAERVGTVFATLRESEAKNHRLAAIVEQSGESILTRDLSGTIISWNRGAEALFGWTAQEAIGKTGRELHLSGMTDDDDARMLLRMRSAESSSTQGVWATKSGAKVQVQARRSPLLDDDGNVIGEIGVARDIGALEHAQQALRHANDDLERRVQERTAELGRNEALLRAVMDALPGLVNYKDAQGRYQLFNRRFEAWLGLGAEAIRGKTASQVMSAASYAQASSHFDRALAGQTQEFEWCHRLPDGEPRDVHTTLVPVAAADASNAGVVSFTLDITERKRAEATLRASETRNRVLATMVEQSTEAIHARDLDGRVTYWNQGAEKLLGYSAAEALGQPLCALHLSGESEAHLARIDARARAGRATEFEGPRTTKAGQTVFLAVRTAPLFDSAGRLGGEVIVMRDITAAKHAERELRRAKEAAEAASRAKGEFLANMSHEIRTPLNGVLGLTELVLASGLTREQRADLELVRASGHSLLAIINDVLDFSKIDAGHLRLEAIEFAPADAVADMVKALAPRAHEKGLELIYDAQGLPPLLVGDPGRLRQIVVNLVGNAIKFTARGDVAVTVGVRPAGPADPGHVLLHVSVRDSGIGIAAAKHASIFDAFTQADASTTRRYGGTGLGLTISARLARLMGGTIELESVPGQGSTFSFSARCGVVGVPAAAAPRGFCALRGQPVLVVEDNAHYREVLVRLLDGWGMAAQAVGDGEAALEWLACAQRDGRPAPTVLLDVLLPGLDGFGVAQRIRREPLLAGPVVVLTGAAQRGDAQRWRELGVAAYLCKPVRPSELYDALVSVIEREPADVTQPAPLSTRHSLREARRGSSILVAEDNPTNQLLARRVLQQLGHRVQVAADGAQALAAIGRHAFDLVLMDMQMPMMGGLEATAQIRAREAGGATRLAIVALTANAMQGDREACLAAGMDDFLTKPYSIEQMRALLRRWLPDERLPAEGPQTLAAPLSAPPTAAPRGLDVAVLKGYLGDDDGGVEEMLRGYLDSAPLARRELLAAQAGRSAEAIHSISHQLKSVARTVGALALGDLFAALESAGRAGDWRAITAAMARLDGLLAEAAADAQAWLRERVS